MLQKRYVALITLIMSIFMLIGCGFGGTPTPTPGSTTGSLKVTLDLPTSIGGEPFETSDLADVRVTIQSGADERSIKLTHSLAGWIASFENLEQGTWGIEGVVKDADGYQMLIGAKTVSIGPDMLTDAYLNMVLQPGDLHFTVEVPADVTATQGSITLTNKTNSKNVQTQVLTMDGSSGSTDFIGLVPGLWAASVEFKNAAGKVVASGQGEVRIAPGRPMTAAVEMDTVNGSLKISLTWEQIPGAPTGLTGTVVSGAVQLSWNASTEPHITGYLVYRSKSNDPGTMTYLTSTLIQENSFIDTNLLPGVTYWYWVQAYNSNGVSSSLSEPISITINN